MGSEMCIRDSTATQPHIPPVNSQQANHNNSPDVLEPLLPSVRAKAKIIGDDFSMLPSRMREKFVLSII